MTRTSRSLIALIVVGAALAAGARPLEDDGPVRQQPIQRASGPITVDGELDEPAWADAWSMELAYEVRPGENVPPPVRTVVLAAYDDRAVYFAFRAFDPEPEAIRAHLTDRDRIGADDWVAVILDTFNDERRSFGLLVNPLGVQNDFVETEGGNGGGEWDTIWESAGAITDWGYAVEMRVPFSSLRFQRAEGPQTWGFDAIRSYPRSQRHHIGLFPRDRALNCYLCQAIKLEGFEGVTPGKNLEIVPTLTAVRTDQRDDVPDGELAAGATDIEAGITGRWGVTPNLTLSGTVNPDFSQVEADARQLEVNERFALFFPEKRPFFMEGADFFSTRLRVLHTRTMHDPSWGVKVSGKEGDHTLGAYVVQDTVTNLLFPGSQGSDDTTLETESTAAALRYKRDLGSRFTLGAFYTGREGDSYSNQVLGLDGDLRLSDTDRLQVQVLGSRTRYPGEVAEEFEQPEGSFSDWAADVLWVHDTRHLDIWGLYQRIGSDFRADLGFIPQAGKTVYLGGTEYEWIPEGKTWFSFLELGVEHIQEEDEDGFLLTRETSMTLAYEGPLQSHAVAQVFKRTKGYEDRRFNADEVYLHNCMKPNGNSHVFFNLWYGNRIDYANVRQGRRLRVQPGFTYFLGRHLQLDLEHLYERLSVDAGRLYTANISQGTVAYQFTTRAFVRAILQYVNNRFEVALYDDPDDHEPEERDLFVQLLFSYKLNPQTVFFLGYSESSEATQDFGLTTANRTVFAKLGYAWTF